MAARMDLDLLCCVALVSEGCTFFNHARESRWLAMLVVERVVVEVIFGVLAKISSIAGQDFKISRI